MRTLSGAALLLLSLTRCTEAGLQPTELDAVGNLDNLLNVTGEFCAQPDAEINFPVKVLFVLDQSTSLQCTDNQNRRFDALNGLISELRNSPDTSFGFIGFANWSRLQGFTRNASDIQPFVDPSGGLGPATDYQGALSTAIEVLEDDMRDVGLSERARSRYVVIFISDGVPEPRCNAGCEDDQNNCSDGEDNDGDGRLDGSDPDCSDIGNAAIRPDTLYGVCNTDQEIPDDIYVDYRGICPAYNQPETILQRVDELLGLADLYSVGDITLHTVLMFSPQAVVESICPGASTSFGYDLDQARALLKAMARTGMGTFRDANLADNDDSFLRFDFSALEAPQTLSSLVAMNTNARIVNGELEPDTDADGMVDEAEASSRQSPRNVDGDDDGYTDTFEARLVSEGFDPVDANVPGVRCRDRSDLDGDGLRDCEEEALGSNVRHTDTDDDQIPDWIEFMAGTDPLVNDGLLDLDFDGNNNADEIRGGTDPIEPDQNVYRDFRTQYNLVDLGRVDVTNQDGETAVRQCHQFDLTGFQLISTPLPDHPGRNRIYVYALERPAQLAGAPSTASVACFEAIYRGGNAKDPADGVIDVSSEQWTQLIEDLQMRVDGLRGCSWFPADSLSRNDLEAQVSACMPPMIQLDNFVYDVEEVQTWFRSYLGADTAVSLPPHPSSLFIPTEIFEPDRHCHRPWEIDLLVRVLDEVARTCDACASFSGNGEAPSPCCENP